MKSKPGLRGFLVFAGLAVLAFGSGSPARADQPERVTIPVDDSYVVASDCGFDVVVHEEGTIRITVHQDNSGSAIGVDQMHLHGTFTNPASGSSLSYNVAARDTLVHNSDNSYTITFSGNLYNVHGERVGSAAVFAGRAILRTEPGSYDYEVIFQAGRTEGESVEPANAICLYLQ